MTNFLIFPTVVLLIALSQVSTSVFSAALPIIASDLKLSVTSIEPVVSLFFLGFASGTLFWGTLSDVIGRRKSVVCGLLLYVISLLLCSLIESNALLAITFTSQGFGVSICSVLAQAVIRDFVHKQDRHKLFVKINMIIAFVPSIGLFLGSIIASTSDWKYAFYALSILGLCALCLTVVAIPKTIIRQLDPWTSLRSCFQQIINDKRRLGVGFLVGGSMGLMFGYLTESGFYFLEKHNFSSKLYQMVSFGICIPMFLGGVTSKLLKISQDKLICLGINIIALGSIAFYIAEFYQLNILFSILCVYLMLMGTSIIIPNCLSQMLESYRTYIGTAASLYGFYYYTITSLFIAVMAILHRFSEPLPIFFSMCAISFLLVNRLTSR